MGRIERFFGRQAWRRGYTFHRSSPQETEFLARAREIGERLFDQTVDDALALREKYRTPTFGEVQIWDMIEKLALVCDPYDTELGCANQLIHVLQMLESMDRDGVDDQDMKLAAILHDLGKVILLKGEAPENVVGPVAPISECAAGGGLDKCVMRWSSDEFIHGKLKDYVSEPVAWLLRYHGINPIACGRLMDDRDRAYAKEYLVPFHRYDQLSKSPYGLPRLTIDDYRELVEQHFPVPIPF